MSATKVLSGEGKMIVLVVDALEWDTGKDINKLSHYWNYCFCGSHP
jgi:hypothetical protein